VNLDDALEQQRPALLRHCYRMLGSFDEAEDQVQVTLERAWKARETFGGQVPLEHWLHKIATNACLNALESRKHRTLPQLESEPGTGEFVPGEREPAEWITPAPDAKLFPSQALERRETVALAFIALLQRLPPRQRAALLMKDVLGWPAEEIADALELTVPSVNSALHRARETLEAAPREAEEPAADALAAFVRAWESRDLDGLVALLKRDVEIQMPPHSMWLRGVDALRRFFSSPRFQSYWSDVVRVTTSRANGLPALIFQHPRRPSTMVVRWVQGQVHEMTVFIGDRTVS
jgi:RNA polymerase sigma-70 factor (ECF subfamily)